MTNLLVALAGMSVAGAIAAAAVMLLRLAVRSMPVKVLCMLWLLVGLRLALPFSPLSWPGELSERMTELTITADSPSYSPHHTANPVPQAVDPAEISGHAADSPVVTEGSAAPATGLRIRPAVVIFVLWLTGAAAVLLRSAVSYAKMHRRLLTAVLCEHGKRIFRSEFISSPFVFGIVRPGIYLPCSMSEEHIPYVLRHERAHIARCDHIVRCAFVPVLAAHWFNPVVWTAYALMCRDMELACDERAVSGMDHAGRQRYSAALLACSTGRSIALSPVGFGDVSVKERIINIMEYSRRKHLPALASAAVCIVAAACIFVLPVGCAEGEKSAHTDGTGTPSGISSAADVMPETAAPDYDSFRIAHINDKFDYRSPWRIDLDSHWRQPDDGKIADKGRHELSSEGVCAVCGAILSTDQYGGTQVYLYDHNGCGVHTLSYSPDGTAVVDSRTEYVYDENGSYSTCREYEQGRLSTESVYTSVTPAEEGKPVSLHSFTTYFMNGTVVVEYFTDGCPDPVREVTYDAQGALLSDYEMEYTRHETGALYSSIKRYEDGMLVEHRTFNEYGANTGRKVFEDGRLVLEEFYNIKNNAGYLCRIVEYDENGEPSVTYEAPEGTLGIAG